MLYVNCGRAAGAITPIIGGIAPWLGPLQAVLDFTCDRWNAPLLVLGVKNLVKSGARPQMISRVTAKMPSALVLKFMFMYW